MIPPWAKVLAILLVIGSIFQVGRVYERRIWERDAAVAQTEQTKRKAEQDVASAEQQTQSAQAGTTTVTNYADRQEQDRAPLERVVYRTRNICLRDDGADRLPVSESPGAVQASGGEAGDDRDDAFIAALERDLGKCNAELIRLDESARYLRIQDGEEMQ